MSRQQPRWLSVNDVIAIHDEQLAIFGGPEGLGDAGLLESALARPLNRWTYGEDDLAQLASAYAFGLAKNHAFIDGNKRAAFAVMMVFLRLNGIPFRPDPADAAAAMLALAAGEVDEDGFARWVKDRWPA